jgi:hypothetical protein
LALEQIKKDRQHLRKAFKSKLLLVISSNTYQAEFFRVKREHRERGVMLVWLQQIKKAQLR